MRNLVCRSVVALFLALVAAPAAHAAPLSYVAMGDSYSAASGVLPIDSGAFVGCLRSTRNYPHVLAQTLGAQLTDVTCGGAESRHYFSGQYPSVDPQLDALSAGTQLVTMTIGGNDSGVFINTILRCGTAGLSTLGTGSPCKDRYGSSFADTLNNSTYPSLVKALNAVHAKAPAAQVLVLGYPWIMPATGGCFDKMPIASGDVSYVRAVQGTLNDVVKRAAAATNSTYVDFSVASDGHDACQAPGVRWIEPVLQGTNTVIVHPNALGESKMAGEALKAYQTLAQATRPAAAARLTSVSTKLRKGMLTVTGRLTGSACSGRVTIGAKASGRTRTTSAKVSSRCAFSARIKTTAKRVQVTVRRSGATTVRRTVKRT